jgi:arginase
MKSESMSGAERRPVRLLGVPMDLGAGRRGVDMGPSAIRIAGVGTRLRQLGYQVVDEGDIPVPSPETIEPGPPEAKFLEAIRDVCDRVRGRVREALGAGSTPVVMGGDHSIAIGTVSGVAEHYRVQGDRIGLIWVDAHADMNTPESSPSGNIHGMPLAVLVGMGPEPLVQIGGFGPKVDRANVCLIGIRNLDDREKEIVTSSGVWPYTMRDVDERGMSAVMREAIERACAGTAGFHLSFDLDGMDPMEAPGVGTPVRGGIDWREAHLLMEMAADSRRMTSLEITELNPILDVRNQSGQVAVELILSAFGKRIL